MSPSQFWRRYFAAFIVVGVLHGLAWIFPELFPMVIITGIWMGMLVTVAFGIFVYKLLGVFFKKEN